MMIKGAISFAVFMLLYVHAGADNQVKLDSLNYLFETAESDSAKVNLLVYISRIYENTDLSLSLQYSRKALEIAEKNGDRQIISYALFNLGNVSFSQGLFPIAVNYFHRYIEIQQNLGNAKSIAYAQVNLGAIHLKIEQHEQAKKYFLGALEAFRQLDPGDTLNSFNKESIHIYNNLGVIHQREKDVIQAIEYYGRGISLARKTPGQNAVLAMLLNNLGSVMLETGKTEEAFSLIQEALEIRLQASDRSGEASSYKMIARYHNSMKNYCAAEDYLKKAFSIAGETGNISLKAEICNDIFDYYQVHNQADSALRYHILLKEFNDIMNREETLRELTRIELTSQFEQQDLIRQAQQKRLQTKYLIAGLAMVLILVILALLYFLSWSRMRRLKLEKENMKLVSKNLELEKITLHRELELRNKELATNVMYQIQKNELVHEIVKKVQGYSRSLRKEDQQLMLDIVRGLEKTQDSTAWNEFELRFHQVHNNFYDRLNAINPDLSPNDRRLCAFLRLNMSTKEIASITGQSIRSIEVARTRLRRKLNLTNSDTGLVEFLSQL